VVWIIGSSATREALTSSHELAEAIAESGGPQVAVEILAAGGLYIEESLVVLDHIPLRPGDLVVSEVSPRNLALPAEQLQWLLDSPRLPLDGPTLDQFATAHGLTPHPRIPGSHLLSFPDFWSARMGTIVHAMHGGPRVEFHLSQRAPPPDPHRWDLLIQRVGGWGTRCVANSALHLDGYAAMVERVSATGAALVLLDAPRNPEVLSRIGPEATRDREACQQRIIAFAMAHGVERWEPAIGARLLGRDFIDHAHVIAPPARARFTADVANAITRTLGSPP
jgi:hypothetical protein